MAHSSDDTGALAREPSRRSRVAPFLAMDVMSAAAAREKAGASVIHLEVGEPAAPAPRLAREAATRALAKGRIGYTEALGRPLLRARIARHYGEAYGIEVDAAQVIVTTGSSGGFTLAFLALFDAGARVLIASPGYPAYRNIMGALGVEVVEAATSAASGHIVTAAMIEEEHAGQPLDGVLLMSPANPTGAMTEPGALEAICAVCDRLGIAFISDEIYHGLTYARPAATALAFSRRAIVINSMSKYYCMTGWRIGWMIAPESYLRPIERLQQNLSISVPTLSQIAAEAAFEARDELEIVKAGYAANRELLMNELPRIGFGDHHPMDGAFYAYVNVSAFTNDSIEFCQRMLAETGVATTPGVDFDRLNGHRALRISYAGPRADIEEALRRLSVWRK